MIVYVSGPTSSLSDPNYSDIVVLVQGGTNASTDIYDLGPLALTASITSGASFDSAQQVYGANMIKATQILPGMTAMTSSGPDSVFARPSGEDCTIECYFRWSSLPNTRPSAELWDWRDPAGNVIGSLRITSTNGALYWSSFGESGDLITLSANTTYFTQTTVVGNTVTVDVNGTEVLSQSIGSANGAGTYSFRCGSLENTNTTAATWWTTPLRFTKNVARARGSVPSASFPIN